MSGNHTFMMVSGLLCYITVALVNKDGKKYYPSEFFKESSYFHYEDKDEDLCELVDSIERLIKQGV